VSNEIEDLHEEVFGFRPAKPGTAYERLGAIVLAARGWEDVVHDETVTPAGRQAAHQLDITGRLPTGELERTIVECKDKESGDVGQDVLDHLVGVIAQLGADSGAVITTRGYTAGAIAVAADENIKLLKLRHFDPETSGPYVKKISLTIIAIGSSQIDVNVQVVADALPAAAAQPLGMSTDTILLDREGSPAETIGDVFRANTAPIEAEPGRYQRDVKFDGRRLFPVPGGEPLPLAAITWTEVVSHSPHTTVTEFEGEPMLVLEQYDHQGEIESGRMVVDLELYGWDIAPDGRVTERGPLGNESEPRVERRRID
jgi:Restriction endonuclease